MRMMLMDRNSTEIFANNELVYMLIGGILTENDKPVKLFSEDGTTQLGTIDIRELRSIWR